MYKHYLVGAVALAFIGSGAAQAEDFTGPRIEIRSGWDHADPGDDQPVANGISYGVVAGYDFPVTEHIVAGVEAGFDLSDNDRAGQSGNISYESEAKRDIELAWRAGLKLNERLLAYAKAGYSNARFEEAMTVGGTTGNTRTELTAKLDGIRAGAGIEAQVAKGLYAKTEYRYTNYEQGISRHQVLAGVGYRF